MIIAVDAVGGDYYPESPVVGAIQAIKAHDELKVALVGPRELIEEELDKHEFDAERIIVQDAPQIIEMDESPAQAVKTKRKSSIVVGLSMHKAGKCDGFVSAGNTGALLAASTFILSKLEGVIRPTIAAIFPTLKGVRLLLDAGANLEMRTDMYVQFGKMASTYARKIMNIETPGVGLINVGQEDEKGTESLKKAFKALQSLPNFIGNVEGSDLFMGKADIFLCDGMTGNLLLKQGESVPHALQAFIGSTIKEMGLTKEEAALVSNVLKTSLQPFNPENVGGIPFLGIDGVSMVGHGGSTALSMKNMILNAVKFVEKNVNDEIVASLN